MSAAQWDEYVNLFEAEVQSDDGGTWPVWVMQDVPTGEVSLGEGDATFSVETARELIQALTEAIRVAEEAQR